MAPLSLNTTTAAPLPNTNNQVQSVPPTTNHMDTSKLPINVNPLPPIPPISNRKLSISNEKPPPNLLMPGQQTTVPQVPKQVVALPTPSPDKPKTNILMSPLTTPSYTDPIEQSLASLEHEMSKPESSLDVLTANIVSMNQPPMVTTNVPSIMNPALIQPNTVVEMKTPSLPLQTPLAIDSLVGSMLPNVVDSLVHPLQNTLESDIHSLIQNNGANQNMLHHVTNNGFGIKHDFDLNTNNNGFTGMGNVTINAPYASVFDPLPQQITNVQPPKKETNVHRNETDNVVNDRKVSSVEHKQQQQHQQQPQASSTFNYKSKHEQNVKNASLWSSLAKANSPQNSASGGSSRVMDSFKQFQNKAKEKADREKQRLENLELKRQQKQQAEKERMRQENERRKEREEEDALERARLVYLMKNHAFKFFIEKRIIRWS